ncbi:sugar transferase [Carboxylicivirga mesophila]|uniref:Sugar transferase n=1 Tax=Carboxylicivirga mesophila TaxID=1166478 RepID=A0ABS5KCT8_9BACT|nr:sugar transferase [Carboxylicivirga mesophila]MBS2212859.1 sugar transferase [Carboxylicivirga mesophila]
MLKDRESIMQIAPGYTYSYERELDRQILEHRSSELVPVPVWNKAKYAIKRSSDVTMSLIGLLVISPFIPLIYWKIKNESPGPFIYKQERVGENGKTFQILKFRTMYDDAEKNGPALSSATDERVTPFGRFLRKWRIDELPQFINVIKGEMSVIGPRPERQHYINQLIKDEPAFLELLKTKPGITSLGQVLFGYAENKTEMLQRLKLELFYMRKYSLRLDIRIFFYTLRTLVKAEGK